MSRGLRVDGHTMGPVSYALVRHELQQKDPNKHPPSQARVYKESRKRVVGRKYKTNNERTLENIEKMDAVESQNAENGEGNFKDPYYEVVAKDERNQHLHLHGRSAMKSKWKDKAKDKIPSYIFPPEFLQNIKAELIHEVAPDLISTLVSLIVAANPGVQLAIPDFSVAARETSSASACRSTNQTQETLDRDDEERECDK